MGSVLGDHRKQPPGEVTGEAPIRVWCGQVAAKHAADDLAERSAENKPGYCGGVDPRADTADPLFVSDEAFDRRGQFVGRHVLQQPLAMMGQDADIRHGSYDRPHHAAVVSNGHSGVQAQAGGEKGSGRELVDSELVTVILEGAEPVKMLTIPRKALLTDQGGDYVFVVDQEKKAQRRGVKLGNDATPSLAVVTEGLKEGELVIADGVQRVRAGQPVSPAPMTPGAPQSGADK